MKVYVVEVGAYSDRYIDAVFASRELAEEYIMAKARNAWGTIFMMPLDSFPDPTNLTFKEWRKEAERITDNWNVFGDVEAFELWDSVPVLSKAP